jgi:hypothetical protein
MPAILLGLLYNCSPVAAENYYTAKPVICGPVKDIIDTSKQFGELPLLKGEGITMNRNGAYTPSQYVIGLNEETGTWTLIEVLSTGQACVLGTGTKLEIYNKKRGIAL